MEQTIAVIKPDAFGQPWVDVVMEKNEEDETWESKTEVRAPDITDIILQRINAAGFTVHKSKAMQFTVAQAEAFFPDASPASVAHMVRGPSMALVLQKENAIKDWLELCGQSDASTARAAAEGSNPLDDTNWTIRALFGTDSVANAVHGSSNAFAVLRESSILFPALERWERTLAVVTPDALGSLNDVVDAVKAENMQVIATSEATLSRSDAQRMFAEYKEEGHVDFAKLIDHVTSGQSVGIAIEGMGAIAKLKLLVGPTCRADAPAGSLRGRFGSSDVQFGVHASSSPPEDVAVYFKAPFAVEKTLALIKPGVADTHYDSVVKYVQARGFTILRERRTTLSRDQAAEFYAEHAGRSFFENLVRYMTSGPLVALVLAKAGAIPAWRACLGPTNTAVAQLEAPGTIRALYGTDGTRNAGHGSDSPASAAREIRFFFPEFRSDPVPTGDDARAFVGERVVAKVSTPAGEVNATLESVLVEGLTELCKVKPAGLDAIEWLGKWLLENNPTPQGAASEGAGESKGAEEGEAKSSPTTEAAGQAPLSLSGKPVSIVFVLGGPGSGKGTQCAKISAEFGYTHLSTGDLLRAAAAAGDARGEGLKKTLASGGLVSTATVLDLVKDAIAADGGQRFLIDGFPRAMDQVVAFEKSMGVPSFVLNIDAPDDVLQARLSGRGRADDKPDVIAKRIATFHSESAPVIEFYGKLGRLRTVDSTLAPDAVFDAIRPHFQPDISFMLGAPGTGKTSVAKAVANQFGAIHLSTGVLFRAEIASGSKLGAKVLDKQRNGELVSDELTMQILNEAMSRCDPLGRYIIDGFPRTQAQAEMFEKHICAPARVFVFEGPSEKVLRARVTADEEVRSDASPKAFAKRMRVYQGRTSDVIAAYKDAGLVCSIDCCPPLPRVISDTFAMYQPSVSFVLGAPGSGKTAVCSSAARQEGFTHLSAADLLRAEIARESADGLAIKAAASSGGAIPVDITLRLLRDAIRCGATGSRFVIDGFPRTLEQAELFESDVCAPAAVLVLDVPAGVAAQRLADRARTGGRAEDSEEAVAQRTAVYSSQTLPVIASYARQGKVRSIPGEGSPDDVYSSASAAFLGRERGSASPSFITLVGATGSGRGEFATRAGIRHGYHHLRVTALLDAEIQLGTEVGKRVGRDRALARTVSAEDAVAVISAAIQRSSASKFILDGFPRLVSDGFPSVHDQVFALEKALGPINHCICLEAKEEQRRSRLPGALTRGVEAALVRSVDVFEREKRPVVKFFQKIGKATVIDTTASPEDVFAAGAHAL